MTQSSKLLAFLRFFAASFMQSRFYTFLVKIVTLFADAFSESKTRKVLIGKGAIERYADSSVFYRALCKVTDAVIGFFVKICQFFETGAENSLTAKIYGLFFKRSLRENILAFTAFVCVVIFAIPHDFWFNMFALLFAVVLFILYIIAAADKTVDRAGTNAKSIWLSMLVFGFCLILSTLVSYDRADSVRVLIFFVTAFMLCFVLYAMLRKESDFDVIGGFMYAVLIFTSLLAFVQRLLGVEADAALTDMTLNKDMPGRVFSTLGNPNNYAEFLVLFMPFALAFALNYNKSKKMRALLLGGMLLPLSAILLTYSRSGWIALAIAAVIFVSLYEKKLIPIFVILILFALPFIPQSIWNRILTIGNLKDTSSSYRIDIWTGCFQMLKDYWFTGVGLGTGGFAEIFPNYAVGTSGVAPHSHMHFLEMLVELGALGFVSYVGLTFTLIRRSFIASARTVSKKIRTYAIASASAMTGIVMIGCFEYCWFYPRVMFAFFICGGIACALFRHAKTEEKAALQTNDRA